MHVFKNVAQSVWEHITGKKDTVRVREDMKSIIWLPSSAEPKMGPKGMLIILKSHLILSKREQERVKRVIYIHSNFDGLHVITKGCLYKNKERGCF